MFISLNNSNILVDSIFINFLNQLIDLHFNLLILLLLLNYLFINQNIKISNIIILFIVFDVSINYSTLYIDHIFNNAYELNLNLINGLFLIHPILVYIFYSILCYLIMYTFIINNIFFLKKLIYNNKIYVIKNLNKLYINLINIISLAILLGSWWAYQELSWGTWWNWDLIEIINLVYLVISLKLIHSQIYKKINNLNINLILNIFHILILFILIRYSILQSIHNFLSANIQNQYNIYILSLFLIIVNFSINNKFNKFNKFKFFDFFKYFNIYLFIILYLCIINIFWFKLDIKISIYFKIFLISYTVKTLFYFYMSAINLLKSVNNYNVVYFEILIFKIFKNILLRINFYKITHLILFMFLYFMCTFKLDIKFNYVLDIQQNFKYNQYNVDNNIFNNNITNTQNKQYQNINFNNNLSNITFYDNWDIFIECNTQNSLSIKFLSNWLEVFNDETQNYIFIYISKILLLLYLLILYSLLKIYFIRKIY